MIGLGQEPSAEDLKALNEALGEGQWGINYVQDQHGVQAVVSTRTQPPLEYSTRFSPGLVPEQVRAIWQEFTARIAGQRKHEREQEEARARDYRPPASSANEVAPGEAFPNASVVGGSGVGGAPESPIDAEHEADKARIASRPDAEGTPADHHSFGGAGASADWSDAGVDHGSPSSSPDSNDGGGSFSDP